MVRTVIPVALPGRNCNPLASALLILAKVPLSPSGEPALPFPEMASIPAVFKRTRLPLLTLSETKKLLVEPASTSVTNRLLPLAAENNTGTVLVVIGPGS